MGLGKSELGHNMAKRKSAASLQPYPREKDDVLAAHSLFPRLKPPITDKQLETAIDHAFSRCVRDKKGKIKPIADTPQKLVAQCLKHLKERSDPILSPSFVSRLQAEELFELDAVSHEMQRHRMSIGVFYQYLILELMKTRKWQVFDGSREGDVFADINTPGYANGLRLYMSVKKSKDTVGGQDVSGVIRRLENIAKEEKNLTRPYLCVVCVATPAKGKILSYEGDRQVKRNREGHYLSLNCEYWGPGFIFPFITGREPIEVYGKAIKRVIEHLPFMTLMFRNKCATLLREKLENLGLLREDGKVDAAKFLNYIVSSAE